MISDRAPIGVFDSGVGGLTVARAIVDQLPQESLLYIGDTRNSPYGDKTADEVRDYSRAVADSLIDQGSKMIVIACNTATTAFIDEARERYDVPIVEVITPAVRRAIASTHNGKIGVLCTQATADSGMYQQLLRDAGAEYAHVVPCPLFVPFVERGITKGRQILGLAESYVETLKTEGVDTVVLGCTHYPLLTGMLQLVMGDEVTLVNSAEETAKVVYRELVERDLLRPDSHDSDDSGGLTSFAIGKEKEHMEENTDRIWRFESTGDPVRFASLAQRFLGPHISSSSVIPEQL